MKAVAKGIALCWLALALSPCAQALDFEFKAPRDASDPAVADAMRDLAGRVLPVFHDDDPERYLSRLSALQLVAGHFAAAQGTRQALRERHQDAPDGQAATDPRAVLIDLYAQARSIEAEEHVPLAQAFDRAFAERVPKLSDADAYGITAWPGVRTGPSQEVLQQALDRVRGLDQVDQEEALRLVWTWLALDIGRSVGPELATLGADDDRRRYVVDEDVPIKTASGATLHARVVRPKNAAGRLPALLEITSAAAADDAKASAAHGYIGVVALAKKGDARAMIAWIARQNWSDGRVGMFGRDDGAATAWAAASRKPRALKAIATEDVLAPRVDPPASQFATVAIPVLAMTGRCGDAGAGTLHYFQQHTRYNKRADHTLLLGACDVGALLDESAALARGSPVDAAAVLDLRELRYRWFDHVLKGAPVPAILQGRINYAVAGANEWRHADSLQGMANGTQRRDDPPA